MHCVAEFLKALLHDGAIDWVVFRDEDVEVPVHRGRDAGLRGLGLVGRGFCGW